MMRTSIRMDRSDSTTATSAAGWTRPPSGRSPAPTRDPSGAAPSAFQPGALPLQDFSCPVRPCRASPASTAVRFDDALSAVKAWQALVEGDPQPAPVRVWDTETQGDPQLVASNLVEKVGITSFGMMCLSLDSPEFVDPVEFEAVGEQAAFRLGTRNLLTVAIEDGDLLPIVGATLRVKGDGWECSVYRFDPNAGFVGPGFVFRGRLDDPAFGALALLAGAARMPEAKERRSPNQRSVLAGV